MFTPFLTNNITTERNTPEFYSLPIDYPVPQEEINALFFIQKNNNENTIIYQANLDKSGFPVENNPLNISWIRFSEKGEIKKLNLLQKKMAYGYSASKINNCTFEITINAYRQLKLYLSKDKTNHYRTFTYIQEQLIMVKNFYVYAENHGVFPQVTFIELYGYNIDKKDVFLQKFSIL